MDSDEHVTLKPAPAAGLHVEGCRAEVPPGASGSGGQCRLLTVLWFRCCNGRGTVCVRFCLRC